MKYFLVYIATVPIFFAVDLLWLGIIGKGIYQNYIGQFMADSVRWPIAILFYLIYIVGILYFVVFPAHAMNASVWYVFRQGALLGFFAYMTYELTNYAVIKDWPWQIVPIDILWGTVLTGVVATLSFLIARSVLI